MKTRNIPPRDPAISGRALLKRFRADHAKTTTIKGVVPVVALASEGRAEVLFVAEFGGYLCTWNGRAAATVRVHEALAWYRRQIADGWFTERVDYDRGWLLLLGMAEGLVAEQAGGDE